MALPEELELKLDEKIAAYEEEQEMPYITGIERRGIEKGRQLGLQQGLQQGMQKGMQKGMQQGLQQGRLGKIRQSITTVLQKRFDNVSPTLLESLNALSEEALLDMLFQYSLSVPSLAEFHKKVLTLSQTNGQAAH
jgi:flagellar biosynthesis/type III secretory pathway protein FliH